LVGTGYIRLRCRIPSGWLWVVVIRIHWTVGVGISSVWVDRAIVYSFDTTALASRDARLVGSLKTL